MSVAFVSFVFLVGAFGWYLSDPAADRGVRCVPISSYNCCLFWISSFFSFSLSLVFSLLFSLCFTLFFVFVFFFRLFVDSCFPSFLLMMQLAFRSEVACQLRVPFRFPGRKVTTPQPSTGQLPVDDFHQPIRLCLAFGLFSISCRCCLM